MRLSGTKAGNRCGVRSEAIGRMTSCVTAPVRSSQRKRVLSDETSRFIDAAPIPPCSVRSMIHSRTWSVVTLRGSNEASSQSSHAMNRSMSRR